MAAHLPWGDSPSLPSPTLQKRKDYCTALVHTLLRYANEAETDQIAHWLETEINTLPHHRYCPGLLAARYDVFCRFWMKGEQA